MAQKSVLFPSIDTPAVLVNLDQFEANVKEMTKLAAEAGVKLRPHVKVHQSALMAQMQLDAGACGVEVGNVAQAASLAGEGVNDILVAHPFYGDQKFEAHKKLVGKPGLKLSIVVDMVEQAEGISRVGQAAGKKIPVLIKIDTGVRRYGVLPGTPALNLAMSTPRRNG